MLKKVRSAKGFTLIELMIVVAIIGILAAIAIPMYRTQTCKARLTEITNSMSHIASAIGAYYNDNGEVPQTDYANATDIKNKLGVAVPEEYLSGIKWTHTDATDGAITATIGSIPGCPAFPATENTLVLTASTMTGGALKWDWLASTVPDAFKPKR